VSFQTAQGHPPPRSWREEKRPLELIGRLADCALIGARLCRRDKQPARALPCGSIKRRGWPVSSCRNAYCHRPRCPSLLGRGRTASQAGIRRESFRAGSLAERDFRLARMVIGRGSDLLATRARGDYADRVGLGTPTEHHPNVRHSNTLLCACMSPQVARSRLSDGVGVERTSTPRCLLANSTSRPFTTAWARWCLWRCDSGSRSPDESRGCPVGEKSHPWQIWAGNLGRPLKSAFSLKDAVPFGAAAVIARTAHGSNGEFFGLPLW
jgi:hypothetical protein